MKTTDCRTLLLIGFSAFCVLLQIARMYHTETITYIFLVWNLILAWVPYFISRKFLLKSFQNSHSAIQSLWFLLWLLFFPNAAYLITDFIHLHQHSLVPIWFDAFLLNCFAWNGFLLALFSLQHVHFYLAKTTNKILAWLIVIAISGLSGFGIYMGRFMRFNSWDVFINPKEIIQTILPSIIHPFHHPSAWLFSSCFAILLLFNYWLLYFSFHYPKRKSI